MCLVPFVSMALLGEPMSGRVVPLPGQSEGTVPPHRRSGRGAAAGAADRKSTIPAGLLTIQGVADHCAVSYWTARGWIESGKLPVLRLPGRLLRIEPGDLHRFLERCRG